MPSRRPATAVAAVKPAPKSTVQPAPRARAAIPPTARNVMTKDIPSTSPKGEGVTSPKGKPAVRRLRVWVAGTIVGVNHSQEGMGKQRHRTTEALAWEGRVWSEVWSAARGLELIGGPAWGLPRTQPEDPHEMMPIGVRLHFFVAEQWVTMKKSGTRELKKLDVDAPVKPTLDAIKRALGVDDNHVRVLEIAQSILPGGEEPKLPGGYGKTRCGCWVEVWHLTPTELRRLREITPGPPG